MTKHTVLFALSLLKTLFAATALSTNDLKEFFGVSRPWTLRVLAKLLKAGLVQAHDVGALRFWTCESWDGNEGSMMDLLARCAGDIVLAPSAAAPVVVAAPVQAAPVVEGAKAPFALPDYRVRVAAPGTPSAPTSKKAPKPRYDAEGRRLISTMEEYDAFIAEKKAEKTAPKKTARRAAPVAQQQAAA
jgi:hypothetical protein